MRSADPVQDRNTAADIARQRGELLRELGLFTETVEHEFDELVELATAICGKPLGAMTLLDEETQLMKARVGFKGARTMPVRQSICEHTARGTELMMVEDVASDIRFRDNETLRDADIRFYAGMPLLSSTGLAVGALCVMDTEPSTLTADQQRALEILGRQMSNHIRMRERAVQVARLAIEQERSRTLFHTVLNNVPLEMTIKDADGHLRYYNRKVADRFGVTETEWLGKTSAELWDSNTAESIMREDAYVLRTGKKFEGYIELPEPNGVVSYWKTIKVACEDTSGERILAAAAMDITAEMHNHQQLQRVQDELEEANRKLSSLALTDSLTGLWNRRAFDSRLETSVMAAHRSREPMALLMMDVDDFKSINDRFGHPYGDVVLRHIAAALNRVKRAEDIACRFGGEEFAVLMPGSTTEGASQLAQRLIDALQAFPWEKGPVTASMGLAMCWHGCSSDQLIDSADDALYRAKREGKNRVVCNGCET